MATLSGLDGRNSAEDMKPSSSASQSDRTDAHGDVSLDDFARYSDGGFCLFDLLIALRRYLIRIYPLLSPAGKPTCRLHRICCGSYLLVCDEFGLVGCYCAESICHNKLVYGKRGSKGSESCLLHNTLRITFGPKVSEEK